LKFFDSIKERVELDKFYAAAITYAYYCRFGSLKEVIGFEDIQGQMSECLLDGLVTVRVLM